MPTGYADGAKGYREAYGRGLKPDPELWVDEWSDEYMRIPRDTGAAEPGKYRTARTPYAREPMRCLSPAHPCKRVITMVASQLMKTQIALNWIGALIHMSPSNILTLLPSLALAKRVSARIGKTIDATPELKTRVATSRSRDARNTMDTKEFEGGTLYATTAGSASNTPQADGDGQRYVRQLADKDRAYGREREEAAAAALEQLAAQQTQRQALEVRLQEQGKTHWQEMNDAQETQARLRDRLATADLRLSVLVDAGAFAIPSRDGGMRETAGTGGLVHGAVRAQLDRAHAQRIVAITDEGDRGLIALRACQAFVREISRK